MSSLAIFHDNCIVNTFSKYRSVEISLKPLVAAFPVIHAVTFAFVRSDAGAIGRTIVHTVAIWCVTRLATPTRDAQTFIQLNARTTTFKAIKIGEICYVWSSASVPPPFFSFLLDHYLLISITLNPRKTDAYFYHFRQIRVL